MYFTCTYPVQTVFVIPCSIMAHYHGTNPAQTHCDTMIPKDPLSWYKPSINCHCVTMVHHGLSSWYKASTVIVTLWSIMVHYHGTPVHAQYKL